MSRIDQEIYNCSLLFDDDNRVYMVYGYRNIYVQEMKPDISGPMPGTSSKVILCDNEDAYVYYCGSHINKINGKYYLSVMRWPKAGESIRTHYCYYADSIDGEYVGGEVFCSCNGYFNQGIANGGIVDTPKGDYYAVLLQDRGAVGRIPVLVPVTFDKDVPVFGDKGMSIPELHMKSTRPEYTYEPVVCSDDFEYKRNESGKYELKKQWQWNHEPANRLWWVNGSGGICIKTDKISANLVQARNTLTQRCIQPYTDVSVRVNASAIKDGDYAGLCLLQGCYGYVGITKELNRYYLVVVTRSIKESSMAEVLPDYMPGTEQERIMLDTPEVTLRIKADFNEMNDTATFFYMKGDEYQQVGKKHHLYFKVDHFAGCRVGLFNFSMKETGGYARFNSFRYNIR